MRELWRMIADLRRGERVVAANLVLSYTLAMVGLYLLKPARDSFFLAQRTASDLPLAFVITAALAIPVSVVYARLARRFSVPRILGGITTLVALGQVVWWWLLAWPTPLVTFLFYAWTGSVGGLVSSQFWLLGNTICDTRQAKRLFPVLGLGGILGAVLGGWMTGQLSSLPGLESRDFVLATAVVWAVALGSAAFVLRRRQELEPEDGGRSRPRSSTPRLHWRALSGSRHLVLIIGLVSVSMLVSTLADFTFKTTAAARYPGEVELLGFLGRFYAVMNLASLALQLLMTSRLLSNLGVGSALLVLPTFLTLGAAGLVAAPGVMAATLLRGGEMSLKYSLDKTSRELLYLPLPLGLKRQAKVFVDTFVERGSRGLAGLLLMAGTTLGILDLRAVAVLLLVLLAVWILLAWAMRRQYIASFRGAVARRELDREDLRLSLRDPAAVATLAASLDDHDPRVVSYALAMLRSVPAADLPENVPGLLHHPDPGVRQRALALAVEARLPGLAEQVRPQLLTTDLETSRLAAAYLHQEEGDDALIAASTLGDDARAGVLDYLSRFAAHRPLPAICHRDRVLADLATACSPRLQTALAAYLGRTWTGSLSDLQRGTRHLPRAAQGAAVAALGRRAERRHLAALGELLEDRALRPFARRAVAAYGPVAIPMLVGLSVQPSLELPARRAVLSLLARLPYQRTVEVILQRLLHGDGADDASRSSLVPVLVRLRQRNPDLRCSRRVVERLLRREVSVARELVATAARIGGLSASAEERFLHRRLAEVRARRLERVFQLLALQYDVRDIMGAWSRFASRDRRRRADAREFLESLLAPHHKRMIRGIFNASGQATAPARETALASLITGDDPWLACSAMLVVDPIPGSTARSLLESLTDAPQACVAETARLVLDVERRTVTMLSTIEKAILLEKVDHFDAVNGDQLAAIASIAAEETFAAGDTIFLTGDEGDAMYLVVDGEVTLQRAAATIARATAGETFGAWALFDAEPRVVTALAATDCRLLRVAREDFADLMADDIVVAQSLLRSVARRLRDLASRAA